MFRGGVHKLWNEAFLCSYFIKSKASMSLCFLLFCFAAPPNHNFLSSSILKSCWKTYHSAALVVFIKNFNQSLAFFSQLLMEMSNVFFSIPWQSIGIVATLKSPAWPCQSQKSCPQSTTIDKSLLAMASNMLEIRRIFEAAQIAFLK